MKQASDLSGRDVAALLLDADVDTLRRTENAQLATFVLALVILAELRREQPAAATPTVAAGHSLGEYTALVAAGILDVEDGIRLVLARGEAMRAACAMTPGTMSVVVGLDAEVLAGAAAQIRADGAQVWVANLNSPRQTVISGDRHGVELCGKAADRLGALRILDIPVGGAFHTPLMAPAVPLFAPAVEAVRLRPGHAPVVSNVDALPRQGDGYWRSLMQQQLVSPVRWSDTVHTLIGPLGCDVLIEVGPGRTLTGLAKSLAPTVRRMNVSTPDQLTPLSV